jgi:hypothetical protein
MSNGDIAKANVEALITGDPKELSRFLATGIIELHGKVSSIAQHCRYCGDQEGNATHETPPASTDRRTWVMWGVGTTLLKELALPLIVAVCSVVLTLALTGQL